MTYVETVQCYSMADHSSFRQTTLVSGQAQDPEGIIIKELLYTTKSLAFHDRATNDQRWEPLLRSRGVRTASISMPLFSYLDRAPLLPTRYLL